MGINQKSCGGLGFSDNHALAGFQAGNADFAVFISPVNPVAVSDQGAVRVHDLKLGVLEGDAGVDTANLPDKKKSVRGVVKGDSDDILHAVIGDIDRLGGLDDAVPIGGVHFLHDIGPGGEAGPNSGAILSGDFLPDGGAARPAGPSQETELEGASGQGLAGHAVILLDYDPI